MPVQNQDSFLKNSSNKTQLVRLLAQALGDCHHAVTVCPGDAHTIIVKEAISLVRNGRVQVVVEDTDVFLTIMYHWTRAMTQQFIKRCATRGMKREQTRLYNIEDSVNRITPQQKSNVVCMSGPAATVLRQPFGHSKVQMLKSLLKYNDLPM